MKSEIDSKSVWSKNKCNIFNSPKLSFIYVKEKNTKNSNVFKESHLHIILLVVLNLIQDKTEQRHLCTFIAIYYSICTIKKKQTY